MIEHAAEILTAAGTDFTHPGEDGYSQVCMDCVVKCLKANWSSKIRKPLTHSQWTALAGLAQDVIWTEADLERDEALID
jgi:hypothetical protein